MILQADKTSNNFSDRAILKNLGHWLGMQTLAKNKPKLQIVSECASMCTYDQGHTYMDRVILICSSLMNATWFQLVTI